MTLFSLPFLVTAIIAISGGLYVYFKNSKSKINITFALLCIATFVWQFSWFQLLNATNELVVICLIKIGYSGIVFIPIAFFHFVSNYLGIKEKRFIIISYIIGFVFLILIWSTNSFIDGYIKYYWGYYPKAGFLHPLHLLQLLVLTGRMVYLLISYIAKVRGIPVKYNQVKYILCAIALFFPATIDYLVNYGLEIFPIGFLFVLLSLGIFGYAAVKYQLLDIRIAITRAGIFLCVYTLVLGVPFLFGFKTGLWIGATVLMGVLASIGPLVYGIIKGKAEAIILAQQRKYQQILLQASSGMTNEHELGRLLKMIVYILRKAVKIKFAAAFLEDKENNVYVLKAIRNSKAVYPVISFAYDHPLINYIKEHREPFSFEELPEEVRKSVHTDLPITLIIPSTIQDKLLGFLALGEKLNKSVYTQDDINVFKTLSNQAALAVENCLFVEEFKKAQERIFNAEKLASIGGMADGVAHQMKNRLNHFSIVAGEQKFEIEDFLRDNSELVEQNKNLKKTMAYLNETSDSILLNVKKASGVLQGILNFAKVEEKETLFSEFSLFEVVEQATELLNVKHRLAEFPLLLEKDSSDIIYGVKSQIIECVFNILDNGYEAAKEKREFVLNDEEKLNFKLSLKLKIIDKGNSTLLEFVDNGIGVKDENKRKIFAPFFTTKASSISGSGIGMYVVKRMVEENHKGKVWFESEYGEGTRIFIDLPKKHAGSNKDVSNGTQVN